MKFKLEQLNEKNRWEINKIGLLNYWWYDEEEFESLWVHSPTLASDLLA